MRMFFSTPLANQKKARYNMTRRTEVVIFHGGATLAFTDYETEQLRKALLKETRRCAVKNHEADTSFSASSSVSP